MSAAVLAHKLTMEWYAAQFDDTTVQAIMSEALKYQGWDYVYGGSSQTTSFDCSGLTLWCYGVAGISLLRTAQAQHDATQHLSLENAKVSDPIGLADLMTAYWQSHLVWVNGWHNELRQRIQNHIKKVQRT